MGMYILYPFSIIKMISKVWTTCVDSDISLLKKELSSWSGNIVLKKTEEYNW